MTSNTPTFPKSFSENVILLYQNGKANGVVACGDDHPSTDLLKPFPAEEMKAWPVSQDVENVGTIDQSWSSLFNLSNHTAKVTH
jgi:hypothetical protein